MDYLQQQSNSASGVLQNPSPRGVEPEVSESVHIAGVTEWSVDPKVPILPLKEGIASATVVIANMVVKCCMAKIRW